VALAVFVLVGATLVVRTLMGLMSQPMGFNSRDVLTFRTEPPWRVRLDASAESLRVALHTDRARAVSGYSAMADAIRTVPGVRGVGAISRLPLTGDFWTSSIRLPERPLDDVRARIPVYVRAVTPEYFQALGTRV